VQNGNAYEEGLSAGARQFVALRRDVAGDEAKVRALCTLPATRGQYIGGTTDPALIAPDGWTLDQHFLDLPGPQAIPVTRRTATPAGRRSATCWKARCSSSWKARLRG
jgi:hypothetical protein